MCETGSKQQYRERLIKLIHDNVSVCKEKFGGRTLLATESEVCVSKAIGGLELILQDGLKPKVPVTLKNMNLNVNNFTLRQVSEIVTNGISMVMGPGSQSDQPVFWHFVRNHLTRHEQERYYHIQNINTDYGRGRSWLRSSINEHSLDRYLRIFFSDEKLLNSFYEPFSLMNDASCRNCLHDTAKDLRSVIFALAVDRKELDQVEESKILLIRSLKPEPEAVKPVQTESTAPTAPKSSKKTRVRVVDLEEDEDKEKETSYTVAIAIPGAEDIPPVVLPIVASSPSVKSYDSQDAHSYEAARQSSLSPSELRQMLLDLTEKKNQLEETKLKLQQQLGERNLENSELKERCKSLEQQYDEANRENAILKEQLKQYMSAVNMLKNSNSAVTMTPLANKEEASHFEEKLVQVAEMHGELMEFNSHLQLRLKTTESYADRLRTELVNLRGPLPSDYRLPAESNSRVNEVSERPLIHIWIPSTFLVNNTTDSYHVYQIYIRIEDMEWTIFRRYSQLYRFRKEMKKRYPFVSDIRFPPKKSFGRKDDKIVEERRRQLQEFLRQFLNLWTRSEFFNIPVNQSNFISQLPFFSDQR